MQHLDTIVFKEDLVDFVEVLVCINTVVNFFPKCDYNINNGTSFLNLDDHSDIISSAYTSWRFEEDDSLAYIISNTSIRSETSYSEIRKNMKTLI